MCLLGFAITASGLSLAIITLCSGQWQWSHVAIFVGTYFAVSSAITVIYHRYGTHDAFTFTRVGRWLARPLFLIAACYAWQGQFSFWCAAHRQHHLHTDEPGDPHSPYCQHGSWRKRIFQFLWAHMWWIPHTQPDVKSFLKTHNADWLERLVSRWYVYLLVGPVSAMTLTWLIGGWQGCAWYLAAVFIYWHMTACVNSLTHLVGRRRFVTKDNSRNSSLLALFTLGEGWHNNHHRYPRSPRFAWGLWEYLLDIGWWEIWLMQRLGLVKRVYLPSGN